MLRVRGRHDGSTPPTGAARGPTSARANSCSIRSEL